MIPAINNRYQAVAMHFVVSVPFVLALLYMVLAWWQPEPYLTADGGWMMLGVLALTFIGAGPLLTLMVFKRGKKGLVFDLVVIAIVQSFVLCYGSYMFYQARPVFLVFAVDRFTLISTNDIKRSELQQAGWLNRAGSGPIKVVAKLPKDDAERNALLKEVMKGKPDLEFRAGYYQDYRANLDEVLRRSYDIDSLAGRSTVNMQKIAAFNSEHCPQAGACAYYPLIGKARDMVLVINRNDGSVIGAIDVDPWAA
ncbi:MAG: hypothetical protein PVJ39_18175 [Gammaproteobacteria bacterium]|jgi:hypothetical protein